MSCPFCSIDPSRIAFSNDLVIAPWDGLPINPGHLLIIPRRHAPAWPDLSSVEKSAIWSAVDQGQAIISERFRPDGFNVGFNERAAAGQTVFHFHLHIIPRYAGDVADPRGGVRHVIPDKANYLAAGSSLPEATTSQRLVTGGDVALTSELELLIDEGFGSKATGKDAFDALMGLFGMIEVIDGRRPEGPLQGGKWEGWILGQSP